MLFSFTANGQDHSVEVKPNYPLVFLLRSLLGRGAVQSEFRSAKDLYDRVSGGAGPGGVKAVAPIGDETAVITIPPNVEQVSLLGEALEATTAAGKEGPAAGRPVAIVSNLQVEYRPAPAAATKKR